MARNRKQGEDKIYDKEKVQIRQEGLEQMGEARFQQSITMIQIEIIRLFRIKFLMDQKESNPNKFNQDRKFKSQKNLIPSRNSSSPSSIEENEEIADFQHEDANEKNAQKFKARGRRRMKAQTWENKELRQIFSLYKEYGSQWKLISTQFPERSPNSIKNRFYTTIRLCLKALFRDIYTPSKKVPHQIPSKTLLKIYEAQAEFSKFKGLCQLILTKLGYDSLSPKVPQVAHEHAEDLKQLFQTVFSNYDLDKQYAELPHEDRSIRKAVSMQKLPQQAQNRNEQEESPMSEPDHRSQPIMEASGPQMHGYFQPVQGFFALGSFFVPGTSTTVFMPFMKEE